MKPTETLLEMVERHVREGEAHVRRQRAIILELREIGYPTETAEQLLLQFETTLECHRQHLSRIRTKDR